MAKKSTGSPRSASMSSRVTEDKISAKNRPIMSDKPVSKGMFGSIKRKSK